MSENPNERVKKTALSSVNPVLNLECCPVRNKSDNQINSYAFYAVTRRGYEEINRNLIYTSDGKDPLNLQSHAIKAKNIFNNMYDTVSSTRVR